MNFATQQKKRTFNHWFPPFLAGKLPSGMDAFTHRRSSLSLPSLSGSIIEEGRPARSGSKERIACMILGMLVILLTPLLLSAADVTIPSVTLGLQEAKDPNDVVGALQILFIITVLSLAPSIIMMMTSFTRIFIVLSFLRMAMGTQQMPPMQVLSALAIFLTFFIMSPTIDTIMDDAITPYRNGSITFEQGVRNAETPLRDFMFKHTRQTDLALFMGVLKQDKPHNRDDVPTRALIPAFMISELKTSFQIGFILYIPFLIIDMVVASILLSMGMMMLPPIMISLPFKVILFVLVDGWALMVDSMIKGYM